MGKYQLRGVDARTRYADMTADACSRAYAADILRARLLSIAGVVAIGVLSFVAASFSNWFFYAIGIFAIGLVVVLFRKWTTIKYTELMGILTHDCDPQKLRLVLERSLRGAKRARSKAVLEDDIATCEYYCGEPEAALARLAGVEQRDKHDKLGIRKTSLELLCRYALGDAAGAKQALAELKALRSQVPSSSAWAVPLETMYESDKELLRPHDQWTRKDAERMYKRLAYADNHLNRVSAQLRLAEYELLHRGAAEARRLLEDPALEPLCPRDQAERARLLARLG